MKFTTILIMTALAFLLAAADTVQGQECGPGCPACSGKAGGDLLAPNTIQGSILYIPDGEEETAVLKAQYGLLPWMDVGLGYAIDSEETMWSLRVQPIAQDPGGWRPAIILGSGSVQTGGSDQSGYIQIAKTLDLVEGCLKVGLAGGLATDIPDFNESWTLGMISATFKERVSPFYSYDGSNSHVGLTYNVSEWLTMTGFYLEMETVAVSAKVQWSLR